MRTDEKPKSAAAAPANTFFTAGFLRPKRLLIALFAVGTSLFLLNHYSGGGVTGLVGGRNNYPPFDEFQVSILYSGIITPQCTILFTFNVFSMFRLVWSI
jgi:hypothetical protein